MPQCCLRKGNAFVNVSDELPEKIGYYTVQLKSGEIDEALFIRGKFHCDTLSKKVVLWQKGSYKPCG